MIPKLTIVIPTVNRCQLLKRAVESALAQTSNDIEIIVSDNGSTDATSEVLSAFDDPRLRVLHRAVTIDACSHGNFLLDEARGELFLGLSDDDYIEPAFASEVIAFFAAHPEVVFSYTGCEMHYADVAVPAKLGPEIELGIDFLSAFLAGKRDVCWCACVTRTADLRSIGSIPPRTICGDMFYWTKLATRGPVGCINKTLSHYVVYREDVKNSSSGTPILAWAREVEKLTNFMIEACIDGSPSNRDSANVRRQGRALLARSTADQFIWNALRGVSRYSLLSTLIPAFPFLAGGPLSIWIRTAAAIGAPHELLLTRVLAAARKKAESLTTRK